MEKINNFASNNRKCVVKIGIDLIAIIIRESIINVIIDNYLLI
jgi:hypothetical protein